MIYIIAIVVCIIFFIENRISKGKQIHIHFLCVILFTLFTIAICNTLLCITLLYWFVRTIKSNGYFSIKPFVVPLTLISLILLITGLFSVYALSVPNEGIIGSILRDFIVMLFWPILISYTIKNIEDLQKLAYFYAVARIIEVGVIGIIIYFFYYDELWALNYRYDLKLDMLDLDHASRLLTIGAPNSNDAAFVLLGAMGLVAYRLFYKIKIIDLILCLVAFLGMLFTWTRSVWPFVALYFLFVIGFNKRINKFAIILFCIAAYFLSIFALQSFQNKKMEDERLQTYGNFYSRQQQLNDYLGGIFRLPVFWGMYDDPKVVAAKLGIRDSFSSENYTLETFTKRGLLAGFLFIGFFIYFIFSFWQTTKMYIKVNQHDKKNVGFVIAVFGVFISIFLMAQTSLFRSNHIIWIMIGFMSVIKQHTYRRVHYEE